MRQPIPQSITSHAELAARLAILRELAREGTPTEATQAALVETAGRKMEGAWQ